ncbi:hypothetical protein ABZ639_26735 [Saccharomonospora sp. NPDC006951]
MDVDPHDVNSVAALGEALSRLKRQAGKSLSQLSSATANAASGGLSRSTLNGYFKGRHLPQQGVGEGFRLLLRELGVAEAELDAWWATVETLRGSSKGVGRPGNPYPGLRSFDTSDAARFFGRTALTDRLAEYVTSTEVRTPCVVVGASGAGKSSLLRAGLVPRLIADGGTPVVLTAGKRPYRTLLSRLGFEPETSPEDLARNCLSMLIVDQFEEVFSSEVPRDERDRFLTAVQALAAAGAQVVLGLRADFYGHALAHPGLATALQTAQVVVGPMREAELREAITMPAREAGFQVESGLVELLLREVAPGAGYGTDSAHEQGTLPLLSHALQATFDAVAASGSGRTLTVAAYRSTGGIDHAVADTAETAYTTFGPRGRKLARQLFLRLVDAGNGSADTRRIVDRAELFGRRADSEVEELDDLLDTLVTCRLLTADDATVQISHEALLAAWPRLRGWLDEGREGRRVHRKLTVAAGEWRDNGRDADELYQGRALASALALTAEDGWDDLNPLEREFLEASSDKRDREQATARRRVRRRYQLVSAALVMTVLVAATAIYAWRSRQAADEVALAGLSRDIAGKATRLRDTDPAVAAQLAAVAYRGAPTPEARSALLDAAAGPLPARHGPAGSAKLAATAQGLTAMASADGAVTLTGTGEPVPDNPAFRLEQPPTAIALSEDGTRLAVVDLEGETQVWEVADPERPRRMAALSGAPGAVASAAFSPGDSMLAVGGADGTVRLWHGGPAGQPAEVTLPTRGDAVTGVAFAPGGGSLVAGSRDGAVYRFDVTEPTRPRSLPRLTGPSGEVFSVAVSPDGNTVAAGTSRDRAVYLWDVADPSRPRASGKLTGPASWVTYIDFSDDGQRLAAGSSDSNLWEWRLATSRPSRVLPHPAVVTTARYADDNTVLTVAEDGIARTWTTADSILTDFDDTIYTVAFDPGGRMLAVGPGAEDNAIHLLDVSDPDEPARLGTPLTLGGRDGELSGPIALSPDGGVVAAGSSEGEVWLWDVTALGNREPVGKGTLGDGATVAAVDIDRRGGLLAVATQGGGTGLFDISDPHRPRRIATIAGTDEALNDVRFSPGGTTLATGSDDGNAYLYDISTPSEPRRASVLDVGGATSLAFDPGGTTLAVGAAADDNVHRWDVTDPASPSPLGAPLDGPVGDIQQLAFHPARDELAAASTDGTVWAWDLADPGAPRRLATLTAPSDAATSLAYTRQGTRLAGGSRDGGVYLWLTDPEAAIDRICARTGTRLSEEEWRQFLPGTPYQPPCPADAALPG